VLLDTSVLIRHLTGEPSDQAERATRRLATEPELVLTDVVLAECAHVLRSNYGLARSEVSLLLRSAMGLPSVVTRDKDLLDLTFFLYERTAVDFPDAYVAAVAARSGADRVLSFDRDFDRLPGERVEP